VQPVGTVDAAQLKLTEPAETAAASAVGAAAAVVHEVVEEGGELVPVGEVVPVGSEELVVFPDESEPPQPASTSPRLATTNDAPRNTGLRPCMAAHHHPVMKSMHPSTAAPGASKGYPVEPDIRDVG
jgi:hypothetical protein